jgi:DNA-binding response OmpR family regulator
MNIYVIKEKGEKLMTKIMVVDDEHDLREMIELMMKKEGFETETAFDGLSFLEKIDIFQPDIVTLDVMMPGLTTKEILEKLKEKKSNPKVLLLTVVRFSEEEKRKIMNMGNIIGYITKPFEFDDLIKAVKKHV